MQYPIKDMKSSISVVEKATGRTLSKEVRPSSAPRKRRATVEGLARWRLEAVTPVSKWSAIYHCRTSDTGRGRVAAGSTWHVTLSAKAGSEQEVERDYTPVSTAKHWESGRCDLLIKVYPDGQATSWLHSLPTGSELFLSPPKPTLRLPSLVPDGEHAEFRSKSVLIVAGGTGIAPAWQILDSFKDSKLTKIPVTLIYSCRQDDLLMAEPLANFAKQSRQSRVLLTLTEPSSDVTKPFPNFTAGKGWQELLGDKLQVKDGRIDRQLLQREVSVLPMPLRAVVSGPESMNLAVDAMLRDIGLTKNAITLLEA